MKILYCEPGQDPMAVARQYKDKSSRGSGNLLEYWWVAALLLFAVYTFTLGPLKPKEKAVVSTPNPQPTEQIASNTALASSLVDAFEGYCKNPAGGLYPDGETVYLTDGENIIQARCNHGEWETQEAP